MKKLANFVSTFDRYQDAMAEIIELRKLPGVKDISFLNAHACNLAENSEKFHKAICNSSLLLRDGIGVKILLMTFNILPGYNSNGTDLIPLLIEEFKNHKIMFIGASEKVVTAAAHKYEENGFKIAATMHGFASYDVMLEGILTHKPSLLILGMGMPKQELFSDYLKKKYSGDIVVVNGGAVFDFVTKKVNRAPLFIQQLGLEWFYRLAKEPKRLFRRYAIGIPIFFIRLIVARIKD